MKRALLVAGAVLGTLCAAVQADAIEATSVSSTTEFWSWFGSNEARFRNVETAEKEALLDEMLSHLQRVSEALFFEVGGHPDGPTELIITAEGNSKYFDLAREVVRKAPALKGWQFIALKPAVGFAFVTTYEGVRVDPKEMWFLPLENSLGELGLRIAGPAYQQAVESQFRFACHQLIDGGLGEETASAEVGHLEVGPLPDDPEAEGYIEIVELPAYISWRNSKAKPN